MPRVYETADFEHQTKKLSNKQKEQLDSIKDELSKSFRVGKILRYPFMREKKIQGKRVYFLIYEDLDAVLLVAISDKKAQQETIDKIAELLPEFKKLMESI